MISIIPTREVRGVKYQMDTSRFIKLNPVDDGTFNAGDNATIHVTFNPKTNMIGGFVNDQETLPQEVEQIAKDVWQLVHQNTLLLFSKLGNDMYVIMGYPAKGTEIIKQAISMC